MWNLKRNDTKELTEQKETQRLSHSQKENQLMVAGGSGWGEGIVRELWMDVYTLLYLKWITHRMYCVAHGTLLNVMWQPAWKGIWGRRDTRTCMAESLRCSPETITTLLIGCTPKQTNKKSLQMVFDYHPNTTIFFRCILSNTGFSRLGWGFDQRWFL